MNRYDAKAPRALLGLAALAMSAITIGALILLPARLDASTPADEHVAAAAVICNHLKDRS
ncbi:MAG TPA: hypothetical protein VN707_02040 [Casimicrobiaceae bacterium]|jgi:hypothetical protein|nr:hypothetical protein [Casimicrobiaceae bacterium]